jgi:hypothetical protein
LNKTDSVRQYYEAKLADRSNREKQVAHSINTQSNHNNSRGGLIVLSAEETSTSRDTKETNSMVGGWFRCGA